MGIHESILVSEETSRLATLLNLGRRLGSRPQFKIDLHHPLFTVLRSAEVFLLHFVKVYFQHFVVGPKKSHVNIGRMHLLFVYSCIDPGLRNLSLVDEHVSLVPQIRVEVLLVDRNFTVSWHDDLIG